MINRLNWQAGKPFMFRRHYSTDHGGAGGGVAIRPCSHRCLAAGLLVVVAACGGGETGGPPLPSGPPDALVDGTWRAGEIGGQGVADTGQPTLRFTADGRAAGSGGCNTYTGPVSIDGDAMIFGRLASTQKACLPALLDQEQKFYIALAGTRSFSLEGAQLTLRDAAGRPLVQLLRSE